MYRSFWLMILVSLIVFSPRAQAQGVPLQVWLRYYLTYRFTDKLNLNVEGTLRGTISSEPNYFRLNGRGVLRYKPAKWIELSGETGIFETFSVIDTVQNILELRPAGSLVLRTQALRNFNVFARFKVENRFVKTGKKEFNYSTRLRTKAGFNIKLNF